MPLVGERGEEVFDVEKKGRMFLKAYAEVGKKERTREEKKGQRRIKREYHREVREQLEKERRGNGGEICHLGKGAVGLAVAKQKKGKWQGKITWTRNK